MEDYCDPNSRITLIKVPRFLAEHWRSSKDKAFLGYYKKGEGENPDEFLAKCEEGMRRFLSRRNQLSCPTAVQIKEITAPVETMGKFKACLTVYPTLDMAYKSKLKERHLAANARREGPIVNEDYVELSQDRSATLFKYYNPRPEKISNILSEADGDIAGRKKQDTPYSRSKAKVQKREAMDMDELKMAIFKIFETDEGKEGIQFKRICQLINQPPTNIKAAIDEITEQRKRATDHKMVYFLRNHFNQEEKKSILNDHMNP